MSPRNRWVVSALVCISLLGLAGQGRAKEAAPLAEDPVVEQRLIVISEEMRCLVCQNESLAGSRAPLAEDLRREIRGQIRAGKTDAQIGDYLVSRYGDYVLYRPPVTPITWVIWFGPFVLLLVGVVFLLRFVRRRQSQAALPPLSDAERQAAQALMTPPNA
jgi:cytochrome c-type biogenesis protein CcmH